MIPKFEKCFNGRWQKSEQDSIVEAMIPLSLKNVSMEGRKNRNQTPILDVRMTSIVCYCL
jgi:hypothetical protein